MQVYDSDIVICDPCGGYGFLRKSRVTSNKGDRSFSTEDCDLCKGSGRLTRVKTTAYTPFNPVRSDYEGCD